MWFHSCAEASAYAPSGWDKINYSVELLFGRAGPTGGRMIPSCLDGIINQDAFSIDE